MAWAILVLASIWAQTIATLKCPENFIPSNGFCVTKFADLDRTGSYDEAWRFCDSFNPPGFEGVLWAISDLDESVASILQTFIDVENPSDTFSFWNGFNLNPGFEDDDTNDETGSLCSTVAKTGNDVSTSASFCDDSLPFICAIKKRPIKCVDFISSYFCDRYSNYFCNTTGSLATLCPKTCGMCDLLRSCEGKVDRWSRDACANYAKQGLCSSESDNVSPFCQLTCCHLNHQEILSIGDQGLSIAVSNDCTETLDLAKCPEIPDVQKCFHEPDFTFACMHTCCVFSQSIRDTALNEDMKPLKRSQNFKREIEEGHCRRRFEDNLSKATCSKQGACDRVKESCQQTCCLAETGGNENSEASGGSTTVEPLQCESLANIYANPLCNSVKSMNDCQQEIQFRKHCQRTCCDLGFQYFEMNTTPDPNEKCGVYTDVGNKCPVVCDSGDSCDWESCPFSCCLTEGTVPPESTSESTILTEKPDDCGQLDDILSKCGKLTKVEKCFEEPYASGCKQKCCMLGKPATEGPGPIIATTTEPQEQSCSKFFDTASKCVKLATKKKCHEEPYTIQCQKTCCELGVTVFTEIPETQPSSDSPSDDCEVYTNSLNKCYKLERKSKSKCLDYPYDIGCQYTCCKLGYAPKVTSEKPIPTVSGDQCSALIDRATKCLLLGEKPDRYELCCRDKWYQNNCERSCCVYTKYETTEPPTTSSLVCNDREDELSVCGSLGLQEEDCVRDGTFWRVCERTCCFINGGNTKQTTPVTTPYVTNETTTTEVAECESSIFHSCKKADRRSKEYCAAVVATHVHGDDDLCQNPTIRLDCEFSCCVYYYATDEPKPSLPDVTEPENCRNLRNVYDYKTCFANYLEWDCDINCQYSCCLLADALVPVNPGCYDKDDSGRQGFCLLHCRTVDACEQKSVCHNKCAFTCCVLSSDRGTNPSTTNDPTTSEDVSTTATDTPSVDCSETRDSLGYTTCLDKINFDTKNCEPSQSMYDTEGCDQHCCHLNVQKLTTTATSDNTTSFPEIP